MSKIILKGKKVILRPLSLNDAPRFCQWMADPELTTFLSVHDRSVPTLKEEREWIREAKKDKSKVTFSIDTTARSAGSRRDGRHIGSISLFKLDKLHKNAEFGIMIGDKEFWGQGCGTEATKLIIGYGFKKLKLHRIYLRHIAYNIRGHKAYSRAGFKPEGCQRQHIFREGYWHDQIIMGLLKSEYTKQLKK